MIFDTIVMQMLVDVIAVAKEVQPLGSVKRKSDGADLARRDLVLVDQRYFHEHGYKVFIALLQ